MDGNWITSTQANAIIGGWDDFLFFYQFASANTLSIIALVSFIKEFPHFGLFYHEWTLISLAVSF